MVYDFLYYVIMPVLALSSLMVLVRFLKGPTIADRVVALDLLLIVGIGMIAVYSVITNQPTFLDIAMIFALLAFLSTVAFSYYIKRRNRHD